eukprot:g5331.t1
MDGSFVCKLCTHMTDNYLDFDRHVRDTHKEVFHVIDAIATERDDLWTSQSDTPSLCANSHQPFYYIVTIFKFRPQLFQYKHLQDIDNFNKISFGNRPAFSVSLILPYSNYKLTYNLTMHCLMMLNAILSIDCLPKVTYLIAIMIDLCPLVPSGKGTKESSLKNNLFMGELKASAIYSSREAVATCT